MSYEIRPAETGGWLAFAAGPRLLVVPTGDDDFVPAAWAALRRDDGFQAALDLLTSRGLAVTPAFVLVEWADGADARLIVRGEATVTVTHADADTVVGAAGVSTWVERALPATRLAVAVPSATAQGTALLPLERGVALVAEVSAGAPAAAEPSVPANVPATAPKAAPAPVTPAPATPPPATPPAAPATPPAAPATPPAAPAIPAALADSETTVVVPDFDDMRKTAVSTPSAGESIVGETVHRPAADPVVPIAPAETAAGASESEGDHDGHTVVSSSISKLRAGRKRPLKPDTAPPPASAQLVLVLSTTGAREPLTQPILVGRSPSVSKVSGGQIPRLVVVGSAEQDISRNHAQFVVEGGTVVVTDLHSKNGTSIVLPGKKDAQKLRPGEPTSVIPGTVVDLGGGVTLTVDED